MLNVYFDLLCILTSLLIFCIMIFEIFESVSWKCTEIWSFENDFKWKFSYYQFNHVGRIERRSRKNNSWKAGQRRYKLQGE